MKKTWQPLILFFTIIITTNAGCYLKWGSTTSFPDGTGPFPAVLYIHGGNGASGWGDVDGNCDALARAGYVGSAVTSLEESMSDPTSTIGDLSLEIVMKGLEDLLRNPDVDPSRIGLLGFSHGALLALEAAIEDRAAIKVAVLMAPTDEDGYLDDVLESVEDLEASVFLLVSENDVVRKDHVSIATKIKTALTTAGKSVESKVYPPFGEDGHELFFEVRDEYWNDVIDFFDGHLKN